MDFGSLISQVETQVSFGVAFDATPCDTTTCIFAILKPVLISNYG